MKLVFDNYSFDHKQSRSKKNIYIENTRKNWVIFRSFDCQKLTVMEDKHDMRVRVGEGVR
jgi:hypothetical protein